MGKLGLVELLILLFTAFLVFGLPLLIVAFLIRRSDERARIARTKIHQIPGLRMPHTKSHSKEENA